MDQQLMTRRSLLWRLLALPAGFILAACGRTVEEIVAATQTPQTTSAVTATEAATPVQVLEPTLVCGDDDDDDITLAQTEGPYYTPNSPERTSLLEAGIEGTHLLVTGYVLTTGCAPVARALVDFWHCDDAGVYDNVGYKLRGHQFTDENGRYTLETILPGVYPGRTRHIHVKVQAPSQPILTTQLYFPGEAGNARDGIYNALLEMDIQSLGDGLLGTFNFVLDI